MQRSPSEKITRKRKNDRLYRPIFVRCSSAQSKISDTSIERMLMIVPHPNITVLKVKTKTELDEVKTNLSFLRTLRCSLFFFLVDLCISQ
jgi:hypothetical protein